MALKNFPCHHTHDGHYYQVLFKIEIHMPHTQYDKLQYITIVKSSRTLVAFTLTKLFVKLIVEISNNSNNNFYFFLGFLRKENIESFEIFILFFQYGKFQN
jgi:hypothetical protein